jgi:PQQ-dependent dehydrogenase (methanol/ethanol family)
MSARDLWQAIGIVAILAAATAACRDQGRASAAHGTTSGALDNARVPPAPPHAIDDGQWLMAAKNHANTRYSALAQIRTDNVDSLQLAWTFATGTERGLEAAPLVVGDTMYVITPFPNRLYALDVRTGARRWTYEPLPDPAAQGVACCDVVNRGGAYWNGRIYYATLDNHAIAVDAITGKEVWKTRLGDINRGETMTMAPVVVKGKVLYGNSGGELGVRGWITALDAATGQIAWRAYSTGPDQDVLIGPEFKPFYDSDNGKDLGVTTWPPERWRQGGGTVWGWISYDPELDLIYYGTGNPGVWNPAMRPGDNKWASSIFARDPDDGSAKCAYQWSPHDVWDHDGINESIVVDLDGPKGTRQVLLHAERNGYVYVLDRATGEVLSADPFVHITTSRGVDLATGRLIPEPSKHPKLGRTVRNACPAAPGAKEWSPAAWSPETGLLYIPHLNLCMDLEPMEVSYIEGTPFVGADTRMYAGPGGNRGGFIAWDPIARKPAWSVKEEFPVISGALVTAGGLVFYGTMEGDFKALDARTGVERWRYHVPSGIVGQPITFRGPDGKQYVAIASGVGGWAGAVVSARLDARDPNAALGFANAMRDLPQHTERGGTIYVFGLP